MFNFQLFSYFLFICLFKLVSCDYDICKYEEIKYPGVSYLTRGNRLHNYTASSVIVTFWDEFNGGFTYCSGILLNKTFVLTTASCLTHTKCMRNRETLQFQCVNANASEYQAVVGTTYVISNEESYVSEGKRIHINSNFTKSKNYSYDIGALELATPFPEIKHFIHGSNPNGSVSDRYYNFIKKNKNELTMIFYGKSPCSSFISPDVKTNKYMFLRNPEKKYQRLQQIEIDKNVDEEECKRLFKIYKNLGMELCPYNLICVKTLYPIPNCDDLSGGLLVYPKYTLPIGIMISRPVCNMSHYFFVLRISAFSEFIHGVPRRFSTENPAIEDTFC